MAFAEKRKQKLFTEINITPLTDIFLVLLIIMMVIAPTFKSTDNSIQPPEISNGIAIDSSKVTVSITKDGTVYVDGAKIAMSELTDHLVSAKAKLKKSETVTAEDDTPSAEVIVKADKDVKSAMIMDVMDAAQNASFAKMIVAGEPLTKKEEKELKKNNVSVPEDME